MRMLMTAGWLFGLLVFQTALAQSENATDSPLNDARHGPTLTKLVQQVSELGAQVESLTTNVSDTLVQMGDLKTRLDQQTERINEEIEKQRQILDAISTTDSEGRRIPRLSASMEESSGFRDEFRSAVEQSLQQEGLFSIANRSTEMQQVSVNGTTFSVAAGETLQLRVPVGNVVTRLPTGEPRNWTLAAPNYSETIEIVPKPSATYTTYKPMTSTTPLPGTIYSPTASYYSPTTSYYAPTASYYSPTTSYHAPTASYYSPTTSYYAPTTSYYSPTTSYHAPTASYYSPTTSYYAPTTSYTLPW